MAVFEQKNKYDEAQERAAVLRAGLVASTMANIFRKKGSPRVHPADFLVNKERQHMTVEEAQLQMNRWAASVNASHPQRNDA